MSKFNKEIQQHHYLAIDCMGLSRANDPQKVFLKALKDSDNLYDYLAVWYVPLPEESIYDIICNKPEVPGAYVWGEFKKIETKNIVYLKLENLETNSLIKLVKKDFADYDAGLITANEFFAKLTIFNKQ